MPDHDRPSDGPSPADSEFARQAEAPPVGFWREFFDFLRYSKKWWLAPIILWLLILSGFVVFSGAVLPYIYSVF